MYFNPAEFETFKLRETEQAKNYKKMVFLVLDRSGSMGASMDEFKNVAL